MTNRFFSALGLDGADRVAVEAFAMRASVPSRSLRYYNESNTVPSGAELRRICEAAGIDAPLLMLRMGIIDSDLLSAIQARASEVYAAVRESLEPPRAPMEGPQPVFGTDFGMLYQADCLSVLRRIGDETVDLVFADPPFNLDKSYPSEIDDSRSTLDYVTWSEEWLSECVRVLKPGGSLFVWNLPKWNTHYARFLNPRLTFRHWIAVDIKYSLPISGRLYPSHYSLLYYCKGPKPNVFRPDRLPMQVCSACFAEQKDYGGYKDKMNPQGINLTDVWLDIPPVRHSKYKKRAGANELHVRLLDRVIELASRPGDLVLDPFGGSGTTYAVAEMKSRRWIGMEIGPVDGIIDRLTNLDEENKYLKQIRRGYNMLFPPPIAEERRRRGHWTVESVRVPLNGKNELDYGALGPFVPDEVQLQLRERPVLKQKKIGT